MSHHRVGPAGNARLPAARGFVKQANISGHGRLPGDVRRGRARLRGLLGEAARARAALVTSRSPRSSTSPTRRSSSGSTTASSTPRTTASTGTCRRSPTRSRSSSRPTTARSRRSPTRSSTTASASSPTALKKLGIQKGDRVLIYMPMSIEAVVAMQACARIGATHSVVFGGLLRQERAGAHRRRGRHRGHHRRRPVPRRQGDPAEARDRRGARAGRLRRRDAT